MRWDEEIAQVVANFVTEMRQKSLEDRRAFLLKAGIIAEDGKLAPKFRSEFQSMDVG